MSHSFVTDEDIQLFRDFITCNYNAWQPSVAAGLKRLFIATEFENIAEALQLPVNATPTQLDLQRWVELFAYASCKRPLLEKLVGGYEMAIEQRHSKRTKRHRTR